MKRYRSTRRFSEDMMSRDNRSCSPRSNTPEIALCDPYMIQISPTQVSEEKKKPLSPITPPNLVLRRISPKETPQEDQAVVKAEPEEMSEGEVTEMEDMASVKAEPGSENERPLGPDSDNEGMITTHDIDELVDKIKQEQNTEEVRQEVGGSGVETATNNDDNKGVIREVD